MIKLDKAFQSARPLSHPPPPPPVSKTVPLATSGRVTSYMMAAGDASRCLARISSACQQTVSAVYHDFSVCGVFACVSVCVLCVVRPLPLSVLFTGNTQTSHPIARSPPRRPPHKGTDTALILVLYMSDLFNDLLFFLLV